MDQVRREIKRMIESMMVVPAMFATVESVDRDKLLIDVKPLDDSPTIFDVRLGISIPGQPKAGLVMIPKVGSQVIIGQMMTDQWYLLQASDIEELMLNGNSLGGLVDWPSAKQQLDKLSARVDLLYNAIKTGVPIPQDGGVGYQNTMKMILEAEQKEDFSELENEVVKHG